MSETSIKQADSLQRNSLFRFWLWWGFSGQRDPSHMASGSHAEPNFTRFFDLNFGAKLQKDRDHDLNCGPKHINLSCGIGFIPSDPHLKFLRISA